MEYLIKGVAEEVTPLQDVCCWDGSCARCRPPVTPPVTRPPVTPPLCCGGHSRLIF